MRIFLVAIWIVLWGTQVAWAGAWLREKGKTFTSSSFTLNYYLDNASTTYVEHGLRDDMTIGLDYGQFRDRYGLAKNELTVFIRRPLGAPERPFKLAYELGLGANWTNEMYAAHIKTGLSYGRGIEWAEKSGWLAIDGSVTWDLYLGRHVTKIDTTLGLNFNDQWAGIFQVYTSNVSSKTTVKLAPSVVFAPKNGLFKIQVGVEAPTDSIRDTSLKLGVWSEF